ncbi:MAG: hypothetical protein Q8O01_03130 [Candidatus Omnitrophota bacterium]|nr:hypothetical protein [Candidatus Omnitrophota bacterium]
MINVVQVLTDHPNFQMARKYWNKLKERLKKGSESVTDCHQLKMQAADGKFYFTAVSARAAGFTPVIKAAWWRAKREPR